MIRNLLASESIGSQEALRSRLAQRGIDVTQTTLSRDLMDLRATKVRNASGTLIYTVPDHDGGATHDGAAANVRLARWCNTILVICRSEEDAAGVERMLLALAEPGALPEN